MLTGTTPLLIHRFQNVALLFLSFAFSPFNTVILAVSYAYDFVFNSVERQRGKYRQSPGFKKRTVLVTGVGVSKGLFLARLFYQKGHNIIDADFEPNGAFVCGRVSKSLTKFYRLQGQSFIGGSSRYVQGMLDIILRENVDLWVSCSGVASAAEDGEAKEIIEAKTKCKAIQFDVKTTQILHEKDSFIDYSSSIGLTVPKTHRIASREGLEEILRQAPPGRKYIMKTVGVDDSARADMTLLPKSSHTETTRHVTRLRISEKTPWMLQQFIKGPEFCTHALVIKGQVKAFVACPSTELLMHYESLPLTSTLFQAMLCFTQHYGRKGGENLSGHLSFDFLIDELEQHSQDLVLYPIECNPRAHTAIVLFDGNLEIVDSYLSILDDSPILDRKQPLITPVRNYKYYWVGHDLVTKLILPLARVATFKTPLNKLTKYFVSFLSHLLTWKDGTYETWDPLPWCWLYHVYWPMQFFVCLWKGEKWSRLNVSTTKMFRC